MLEDEVRARGKRAEKVPEEDDVAGTMCDIIVFFFFFVRRVPEPVVSTRNSTRTRAEKAAKGKGPGGGPRLTPDFYLHPTSSLSESTAVVSNGRLSSLLLAFNEILKFSIKKTSCRHGERVAGGVLVFDSFREDIRGRRSNDFKRVK